MSDLDRNCDAARMLLEALNGHYRASLIDGRLRTWAKAAHSIVDLLAAETYSDPWLDWLSENH